MSKIRSPSPSTTERLHEGPVNYDDQTPGMDQSRDPNSKKWRVTSVDLSIYIFDGYGLE